MKQQYGLRVREAAPETAGETPTPDLEAQSASYYANADPFELGEYEYPVPGFVRELLEELDRDDDVDDARLVDTIEPTSDIDDGLLVVFPDECLLFLGKDPTAKDAMPWFGFTIEAHEPLPAPDSAQDALDLLKPPDVKDVIAEDGWLPNRHGEWWLLPTGMMAAGTVFAPGVQSKPYGPSPLGNHVPREYAFSVSDSEFMRAFRDYCDSAPDTITTPPEVIQWTWRQVRKANPPEDAPRWADIRAFAGEVLVRGTIRHRDDDHFVEDVGDTWHKATTHSIEVYTADDLGEGVHLDYYGR